MKNIVLVGLGWGTLGFLQNVDYSKVNVTVISPSNKFSCTSLFIPSLFKDYKTNVDILQKHTTVNYWVV